MSVTGNLWQAAKDFGHALTAGSMGSVASDLGGMVYHEGAATLGAVNKTSKQAGGLSLGDYTLIAIGIVLGIGALLISQKQTIVKVGNLAAKGGALVS